MEPKDLITRIAQALVDNPEQVSINEIDEWQHRSSSNSKLQRVT